ncbi:hydroxymethylglutaryl-CoA lyase [Fodinicurvata sp. EGI_FJ10296]|uniref:hydroxymethylglutaryl-CoA lyase n=1 Tax=Fodinicurvata sp. EGI_FJ10296 TaxID=3231908 RepID=UPI003455AA3D
MTRRIRIVEVGPRDGLQNEPAAVPTATRVALIGRLADAGLRVIEAGAFVSPKWVPQMADSAQVLAALDRRPGVAYPVLVPNEKGLEAAIAAGVEEVAVFGAASETFSRKNINCSIAESLERFRPVVSRALGAGIRVRGYVSCVLGCPYEGAVAPDTVAGVAAELATMGCYEISLGDTIGVGTPSAVARLIAAVEHHVPIDRLAAHFHDTYGQALVNIHVALQNGIDVVDSSVAGLGGCPFAKGATGNVATEDVVYMLDGLGYDSGVDIAALARAGDFITQAIGRPNRSRAGSALLAKAAAAPG